MFRQRLRFNGCAPTLVRSVGRVLLLDCCVSKPGGVLARAVVVLLAGIKCVGLNALWSGCWGVKQFERVCCGRSIDCGSVLNLECVLRVRSVGVKVCKTRAHRDDTASVGLALAPGCSGAFSAIWGPMRFLEC